MPITRRMVLKSMRKYFTLDPAFICGNIVERIGCLCVLLINNIGSSHLLSGIGIGDLCNGSLIGIFICRCDRRLRIGKRCCIWKNDHAVLINTNQIDLITE